MGRPARSLHDAGNHRAVERRSHRQAARRGGGLTIPAQPCRRARNHRRSYTTPWGTIRLRGEDASLLANAHRGTQHKDPNVEDHGSFADPIDKRAIDDGLINLPIVPIVASTQVVTKSENIAVDSGGEAPIART